MLNGSAVASGPGPTEAHVGSMAVILEELKHLALKSVGGALAFQICGFILSLTKIFAKMCL